MATLTMIKWCVEGNDLIAGIQSSVQQLESGQMAGVAAGYQELTSFLADTSEFSDILNNAYSTASSLIKKTSGDAESYVQSINLEVQRPNTSGDNYINLEEGSAYYDGGIEYSGSMNDATAWDYMQNPTMNLTLDDGDCYYDNMGGAGIGLGTDWSQSGQINLGVQEWDGDPNDDGMYVAPQASASTWAPYIHLEGGDPSALNADAFL